MISRCKECDAVQIARCLVRSAHAGHLTSAWGPWAPPLSAAAAGLDAAAAAAAAAAAKRILTATWNSNATNTLCQMQNINGTLC